MRTLLGVEVMKKINLVLFISFLVFVVYPNMLLAKAITTGEEKTFAGIIGEGIEIEMKLSRKGNLLSGTYIYKKYGKPINLLGIIDERGHFILNGTKQGGDTGTFEGKFLVTGKLQGRWISPKNEKLPFYLAERLLADSPSKNGSKEKIFTIIKIQASPNEVKIYTNYLSRKSRTEFLTEFLFIAKNHLKIYPKTDFTSLCS